MSEEAIAFDCQGETLVGIVHKPQRPSRRGIVVIVGGGPQYRAGGHRQLTLWARRLCAEGYPVFRFDYRGMGDSHGGFQGFEHIDEDIRAAVDRFTAACPEVDEVVLWGECDASSAILFYAYRDPRVKGAVLLNPWVRTEAGEARAILRFYYLQRLLQPSFWKKALSLRFNPFVSLYSAAMLVQQAQAGGTFPAAAAGTGPDAGIPSHLPLPDRLRLGWSRFTGPVMLVMSGRDLIAREFDEMLRASPAWQELLAQKTVTRHDLAEGDHTFSSAEHRNRVVAWGLHWLGSW